MRSMWAILIGALASAAHAQGLIANGAFEQGVYIGGPFMSLSANSTTIQGWQVGSEGPLRWYDTVAVSPYDERHSVELNEQAPSSIQQIVPTTPGVAYRLRFWFAGDPYGLTTIRTMRVYVGAVARDYLFDVLGYTASSMGWREETIDFTAAGPSTLLRFVSTTPSFAGPFIDAVSMEPAVPICVADVDDGSGTGTRDGGVTVDDLLYYLVIFESGATAADVDDGSGTGVPDGGVTIDDLLYFLLRFELGC